MFTSRRALLLAGCAMGTVWSGSIHAQTASSGPRKAAGGAGTEEIVVTAQRRSQRLVEVPASITAISGRTLARSGVKTVLDLGQVSVGTEVQRQGGYVQPAIRGISTLTTGVGFENNIAIYVDGFYQPDAVSIASGLSDIADIEVLKGPQGTLYGRNATGGAILINTQEPSRTWTGNVQASYARFNDHIVQGYLSGPIGNGDLATFNVAAYNRYSDGYTKYVLGGNGVGQTGYAAPVQDNNVRAKLKLTPTNDVTVTLGYAHIFSDDPFGLVFVYPNYSPFPPGTHATQPNTASGNTPSENQVTVDSFTAKVVANTDYGTLTSRTGFDHRLTHESYDYDGSIFPVVNEINTPDPQNTFQQALDFQVVGIKNLDLLFGAFYYHDHTTITGSQTIYLDQPLPASVSHLGSDAGAIYGTGTYHFGKFALTAGLRGNIERRTLSYYQIPVALAGGGEIPGVSPGSGEKTYLGATPNASLSYALTHRTNFYASFSTGYRSGVYEPAPLPEPSEIKPIKPERITAYEIGIKTSQPIWTLNAAAFYYDYRDLQVGVQEPDPVNAGEGVIEAIINAHQAITYGAELEGTVHPTLGWAINGGLAVLHARYTNFRNAIGVGLDPATNSEVTSQVQDWDGQNTSRAPTISANFGTNYTLGLAGGQLTLAGNGSVTSSYVTNDPSLFGPLAGAALADKQRYRVNGYTVLNADVAWTDASEHYTIGVFCTNFTNTHYLTVYNGSAFGDSQAYGQPAQYGVRLGYKF